jgi:Leucyl-tRNA synthetase
MLSCHLLYSRFFTKGLNHPFKNINLREPFKNLLTQGMVCHETYKDENNNWLYPEEVEKINEKEAVKKKDKTKVVIGPSESMSKSKKNTIDPETMIKLYGADAVRWFMLSDSPPEKDVLWSDTGVAASSKFLQKIWNLVNSIITRQESKIDKTEEIKFNDRIESLATKIDNTINTFKFNVTIAHFYEAFKIVQNSKNSNIGNKCLLNSVTQLVKLMLPITPHLANEILEKLKCDNVNEWPELRKNINENIIMAVQINGKTRDTITVNKNLNQKKIDVIINKNEKIKKFLVSKKILKQFLLKKEP